MRDADLLLIMPFCQFTKCSHLYIYFKPLSLERIGIQQSQVNKDTAAPSKQKHYVFLLAIFGPLLVNLEPKMREGREPFFFYLYMTHAHTPSPPLIIIIFLFEGPLSVLTDLPPGCLFQFSRCLIVYRHCI